MFILVCCLAAALLLPEKAASTGKLATIRPRPHDTQNNSTNGALSVVMLGVVTLSVTLSVVMFNFIMLSALKLNL